MKKIFKITILLFFIIVIGLSYTVIKKRKIFEPSWSYVVMNLVDFGDSYGIANKYHIEHDNGKF